MLAALKTGRRLDPSLGMWILLIAAALLTLLSCSMGAVEIPWARILVVTLDGLGLGEGADAIESTIFWDIRLPRTLLALGVGLSLGCSGAAMQGLMRNPLADPGLLGLTTGASLMAALVIVMGNQILPESLQEGKMYALPIAAFMGSLAVSAVVMRLGLSGGKTQVGLLLLAGLAVNGLVGTAMGLLTYLADEQELRSLTFWSMGSVAHGSWEEFFLLCPLILLSLTMLYRSARGLNAMVLGDDQARCLGVSVEALKRRIVIWVSLAVGSCVALTGAIGFIGLMAPHLVRMSLGPDHRFLLPLSGLSGAVLLLMSDILARTLLSPGELPIGIVTSALGSPLFIFLLVRGRFGGMAL